MTTGISFLVAAGLVLIPSGAYASVNESIITNSGDHVDVSSGTSSESRVSVENFNKAHVSQTVDAHVNTGGNSTDRNIGSGGGSAMIDTGNAGVNVALDVAANENTTMIPGNQGSLQSQLTDVVNTGDHVDINSQSSSRQKTQVTNLNKASVHQAGYFHINTGKNDTDRNIGNGEGATILTGNAGAVVALDADLNRNETAIGNGSSMGADNEDVNFSSIVNTGDDLDSNSRVRTKNETKVRNFNSMYTMQSVMSHQNTGYNDSDRNVGGASSLSGNAGFVGSSSVSGNHNMTFLGNIMDMLFGWVS